MFSISLKVMEVLMSLQGSQLETDDPTTSYMLQVCFVNLKWSKSITSYTCSCNNSSSIMI